MDYSSNMPSNKTNDINKLQNYLHHALNGLDMALQLHVINPFRKWKHKTYIFKQKTFHKILQVITMKQTQTDPKKVIVGFGNWGAPRESIIQGYCRGAVKGIKEKLKRWCKLVDVNKFQTSELCCCCHHETVKVKFNEKEVNSVLCCSNNECRITIERDINGVSNMYMLLTKMVQKERRPEPFCRPGRIYFDVFDKENMLPYTVLAKCT